MAGYGGSSSTPRIRDYEIPLRDGTKIKAQMRTVQGNQDYLDVKWRVVWMRAENGLKIGVISEPVEHVFGKYAIFKTTLVDADGRVIAIAHKMETRDGFADYYEKAETGSLGRALAIAGYGTAFCGQEFTVGDDISESGVERETADSVEAAAKAAAAAAASRRRGPGVARPTASAAPSATSNPPTAVAPTSAAPAAAEPATAAPAAATPTSAAPTSEASKPEPKTDSAPAPEPKAEPKPAPAPEPKADEPKAEQSASEPSTGAQPTTEPEPGAKEFEGQLIVRSRPMTGTNSRNQPYSMVSAQIGSRTLRIVGMAASGEGAVNFMAKVQGLKVGDTISGKFVLIKNDIYAWVA